MKPNAREEKYELNPSEWNGIIFEEDINKMKNFYVQYGIGKCKYVVSYYDGIKTHKDGSKFYDIAIFKNKQKLKTFTNSLKKQGYKET